MESHEELRPYLFAIAYRMLGSVAEAEDVVQLVDDEAVRHAETADSLPPDPRGAPTDTSRKGSAASTSHASSARRLPAASSPPGRRPTQTG